MEGEKRGALSTDENTKLKLVSLAAAAVVHVRV